MKPKQIQIIKQNPIPSPFWAYAMAGKIKLFAIIELEHSYRVLPTEFLIYSELEIKPIDILGLKNVEAYCQSWYDHFVNSLMEE